jgi:hypothetical protein
MSFCRFCGLSSSSVRLKGMMNIDEIRYDVGNFNLGQGYMLNNVSVAGCYVKMFTIATSTISGIKPILR